MSIEIEKKYRVTLEQSISIEERLNESEAIKLGKRFETNILYSNDEMDAGGGFVRLRDLGDSATLTFKRAMPSESGLKTQLEYETRVDSFDETEKIIEHIGLKKRLMYEKRRKIWEYFFAEVVIDELPFGFFIEIEGTPEQIAIAERALGLESILQEIRTYPALTAENGETEDGVIVARF